jgi:hypothetical protein
MDIRHIHYDQGKVATDHRFGLNSKVWESVDFVLIAIEPYINDLDDKTLHPKDYFSKQKMTGLITAANELIRDGVVVSHADVVNGILNDRDMNAFDMTISIILDFMEVKGMDVTMDRRQDIKQLICKIVLADHFVTKHDKAMIKNTCDPTKFIPK